MKFCFSKVEKMLQELCLLYGCLFCAKHFYSFAEKKTLMGTK